MGGDSDELKLLTTWITPYGQRVEIALKLKGIPYERVEVKMWPQKPQFLLDANPVNKKIPVLVHKGRSVCESMIILDYIENTWPNHQPSLFPADSYDRATARFWGDFIYKIFESGSRNLLFGGGQQREDAKRDMLSKLADVNKAFVDISAGRPFFMGHDFGYVDLVFGPLTFLFPLMEIIGGVKIPGEAEWPRFHQWVHSVGQHPCVKPLRPEPHKQVEYFTRVKGFLTQPAPAPEGPQLNLISSNILKT